MVPAGGGIVSRGNMPILWIVAERVPMMVVIDEAHRMGIEPEKTKLNALGRTTGEELRRRCLDRLRREGRAP